MSDQILALDRTHGLTDGQFTFSERVNYLKQFGVVELRAIAENLTTEEAGVFVIDLWLCLLLLRSIRISILIEVLASSPRNF